MKKEIKGSGNLSARSYPGTFPTCEKKVEENLELGVMGHIFNPSTGKVEAGRSLSLIPVRYKNASFRKTKLRQGKTKR